MRSSATTTASRPPSQHADFAVVEEALANGEEPEATERKTLYLLADHAGEGLASPGLAERYGLVRARPPRRRCRVWPAEGLSSRSGAAAGESSTPSSPSGFGEARPSVSRRDVGPPSLSQLIPRYTVYVLH